MTYITFLSFLFIILCEGSCEHISVQCNNENMVLQLNFDSAFFGRIYSKANPTQCYLTGNGENHLDFPIPLNAVCGTRQEVEKKFLKSSFCSN